MIFRPRIFISSTIGENLTIRSNIEDFFASVGAEALLYESNLTPSILPMTYRRDILDADFVILIVKDNYGVLTDWEISGTHEEYRIASEASIPVHVYIKKDRVANSNPLIDEINRNQTSYYYYENDTELYERIMKTTFTIAKEIMLSQITALQLPDNTIKKLCYDRDYKKGLEIIRIIDTMFLYHDKGEYEYDWIDSNIFTAFISPIAYELKRCNYRIFLNQRLDKLTTNMLSIYHDYVNCHSKDYTTNRLSSISVDVPILGKVAVCELKGKSRKKTDEEYIDLIGQFSDCYKQFKESVMDIKLESDKI